MDSVPLADKVEKGVMYFDTTSGEHRIIGENNPINPLDPLDTYIDIIFELKDTYIKKNSDYGNSFDHSIDEFGYVAALVRMSDKFERLKSLLFKKQKQEVADESVLDTMMDLANYSIMLASKYRREKDALSKV